MPLLWLKHVRVFLSLTPPLPPSHTHRGYDQADYKAGQRHRYFTVIILQPSRMSMDTHGSECRLNPGHTLSPAVALISGQSFWGRKQTRVRTFQKLSSSENPCDKLPTDLTENFTGISYFFELTFLENFVLQTSGDPEVCTLNQILF